MASNCFFCGNPASSVDHIPPKCFFPKAKDMPAGSPDYRKQLITLPACKAHNENYSKDDEYIATCIVTYYKNNTVALEQVNGKIIRALGNSLGLADRMLKNQKRALLNDIPTMAFSVERSRFEKVFERIGKGLYFYKYGKVWDQDVIAMSPSLRNPDLTASQIEILIAPIVENLMNGVGLNGENPDVFYYQHISKDNRHFFKLTFYGGFVAYVLTKPEM